MNGYKVMYVPFSNGKPDSLAQDVVTGFLNDDNQARGRPVGLSAIRYGASPHPAVNQAGQVGAIVDAGLITGYHLPLRQPLDMASVRLGADLFLVLPRFLQDVGLTAVGLRQREKALRGFDV